MALKQIVGGTGSYDDIISYVSKKNGSVKSVDDIATFIKSDPELLKVIAMSSDVILKNAAQDIIKNSEVTTLLSKDLIDHIEGIILYVVDVDESALITKMTDDTLLVLNRYRSNSDILVIIKKLEDKKSIINNMNPTSTTDN